jgi:hypothetical protein
MRSGMVLRDGYSGCAIRWIPSTTLYSASKDFKWTSTNDTPNHSDEARDGLQLCAIFMTEDGNLRVQIPCFLSVNVISLCCNLVPCDIFILHFDLVQLFSRISPLHCTGVAHSFQHHYTILITQLQLPTNSQSATVPARYFP